MKISGLSENERAAFAKLKKALEERFDLIDFRIFGSKARGEATAESDIDVMIEIEDYAPKNRLLCARVVF